MQKMLHHEFERREPARDVLLVTHADEGGEAADVIDMQLTEDDGVHVNQGVAGPGNLFSGAISSVNEDCMLLFQGRFAGWERLGEAIGPLMAPFFHHAREWMIPDVG